MEYNFSVTPRLLIIFVFCSVLFVLCVFFAGAEVGKIYANANAKTELMSKSQINAKLNELKPEVNDLKKAIEKSVDKPLEAVEKK
jgi:hypothetical protein